VANRPLFKRPSPPLSDKERLAMLHGAIEALAQRSDLDPRLQARGIAPLAFAARRLEERLQTRRGRRDA